MHFIQIDGLTPRRVTGRAEQIANVIMDKAGLDSIKINQGDGPARLGIDHDVIKSGVAVHDPLAKSSGGPALFKQEGNLSALGNKMGQRKNLCRQWFTLVQYLIIAPEIPRRAMKTRQSIMQPPRF